MCAGFPADLFINVNDGVHILPAWEHEKWWYKDSYVFEVLVFNACLLSYIKVMNMFVCSELANNFLWWWILRWEEICKSQILHVNLDVEVFYLLRVMMFWIYILLNKIDVLNLHLLRMMMFWIFILHSNADVLNLHFTQ